METLSKCWSCRTDSCDSKQLGKEKRENVNKSDQQRYREHWPYKTTSSSSVICQTTGSKPLPKRFLYIVRSRASSFNWQYPLLSLRSSSSFLRLLPRLLVTSICLFIFPSIICCRRQFLRKMWPIQLAFRFLISCIKYRTAKINYTKLFLNENHVLVNILGNVAKAAETSYKHCSVSVSRTPVVS